MDRVENWDDSLLDQLEELKEIVRKAEEESAAAEQFSENGEHLLCKAVLWSMEQAVSVYRLLYDESDKAEDFLCEKVNPAFETVSGIPAERAIGRKGSEIFGEKIPYFDIFVRVAETRSKVRFKAHYPKIGKYFDMWVFSPEWGRIALVFSDVTDSVLAEREQQLDRRFLDEILDSMNVWLMIFDKRWNPILWNKAAERLSGYCSEEALSPDSRVLEKLFPEELYREYVLEEMKRAAHRPEVASGELETEVSVNGGRTRTISWTCSRWTSREENEEGIIAAGRDLTEMRALEGALRESERRYSSIFLNSNMAMLIIDPEECRILDCNDAACRFYGYSREELAGICLFEINISPREEIKKYLQRTRNGERSSFVFFHRRKDGALRKVEAQVSPLLYDGKVLVFSLVREIGEGERNHEDVFPR